MAARSHSTLFWIVLGAVTLGGVLACPHPTFGEDEDCLECHAFEADLVELQPEQRVVPQAWFASIHSELGFACADCHDGKEDYPHEPAEPITCSDCHDDAGAQLAASVHGQDCCANGHSPFPTNACAACHGVHDVKAVEDPESRVYFRNIPETCGGCHGDLNIVQSSDLTTAQFDNYQRSVHGLKLGDPDAEPAVCSDCHGAHDVTRARTPRSPANPFQIASTCGRCHARQTAEYSGSVHGEAFDRGVSMAPDCTDCHGIHTIKMVPEEGGSLQDARLVRTTCPACHASEALMTEYGVATHRVDSYRASYHGLANQRGTRAVADCASCHGIHAIYPSSDPRSSVAPKNLQQTCGSCHPGASEAFSRGPVHFTTAGEPSIEVTIVTWVKRVYWALILMVLGGMVLHNAVIMGYYVRRKFRAQRRMETRQRFSANQVFQHAALIVSFVTLVISGFMLAYPDQWWSRVLVELGITESIRRNIHRVAACVMAVASVYHLAWIWSTPYGRRELRRIAPGLRDLRELAQNMRFHLGRRDESAAFGKYDYPAKAEYWALVWGTIIMGITGAILWFPVWATSFLPFWVVKVSEVVHLFEAWLATLAIVLFHFFYVIFHPEGYPLNLSMFSGRMPRAEAEHHHPTWEEEPLPPIPVEETGTDSDPDSDADSEETNAPPPSPTAV